MSPDHPGCRPGSGRAQRCASAPPCPRRPRERQHVSHLAPPMPNPFRPPKKVCRRGFRDRRERRRTARLRDLADAVGRSLGGVEHRQRLARADRRLDLAAPSATAPALRASPSEPSAALASSRSTMSPRSAGTWTSAFSARANSFLAAARSTWTRSAVTQQPRPGRFLFRSGTRAESGPTTNRMRSSGAPLLRVTMHVRSFISSKGYSGRYACARHAPAVSSTGCFLPAARSSSVIQPAFSRAAITICSASSRDTANDWRARRGRTWSRRPCVPSSRPGRRRHSRRNPRPS